MMQANFGMILLAGMVCLAGCGGSDAPGLVHRVDAAACGADRFAALQGKPVTSLPGDEVAGPIRLIRPGDSVTRDLQPQRLNLTLDAQDVIQRLSCG